MSEPTTQRPSFLALVPTWQRPLIDVTEVREYRARRGSEVSFASVSSTTSTDYGENGFLVLTANTSFDERDDEVE